MSEGYLSSRRPRRLTLLAPSGTRARMVEHRPADEAYDRWAAVYDRDGNHLLAVDEAIVQVELGSADSVAINAALLTFFDEVFDKTGYARPEGLNGFPPGPPRS